MRNEFLKRTDMSLKAKGLLALLMALPDDNNFNRAKLSKMCAEEKTALNTALRELESLGYLKIERRSNDKGRFYYEYIVTDFVEVN